MNRQQMTPEQLQIADVKLMDCMADLGKLYLDISMQVRRKPLIGGSFGSGKYLLASHNCIATGLDRAYYMVLEERTWLVVGGGDSIAKALQSARIFLGSVDQRQYALYVAELAVRRVVVKEAEDKERLEARLAWIEEQRKERGEPVKSIPRRRRQIFEASNGQCHYCATPLTLDGRWHIEHKMPKALMGGNEPSNLVAACAPCNHKKRDRTDQEFIASRNAA